MICQAALSAPVEKSTSPDTIQLPLCLSHCGEDAASHLALVSEQPGLFANRPDWRAGALGLHDQPHPEQQYRNRCGPLQDTATQSDGFDINGSTKGIYVLQASCDICKQTNKHN